MTSRYADQPGEWAPHSGKGLVKIVRRDPAEQLNQPYDETVMVEGDDVTIVSQRWLESPHRYWEVMDMNPSVMSPDDLRWGQRVVVPTDA